MKVIIACLITAISILSSSCLAFVPSRLAVASRHQQQNDVQTFLYMTNDDDQDNERFISPRDSRRGGTWNRRQLFGQAAAAVAATTTFGCSTTTISPPVASAQVFMDPAQYGDQELRVAAVASLKESVRRAILQTPALAPAFYQLAVLDALSYDARTNKYGPDGSILQAVLSSSKGTTDPYTANLQKACLALIEAEKNLKRLSAISIADAIALAGAEAIESIGGPVLTVQLGRADTAKNAPQNPNFSVDLLAGQATPAQVVDAFRSAGMTEREMTAILIGLMTLETVEKTVQVEDWKASAKPKFREPGKMGRMSEFKRLTEEDIAEAEAQAALEADPEYQDPDDGWYIADSFGDRDSRFGQRIGKESINEKNFNKYLIAIQDALRRKRPDEAVNEFGWVAEVLVSPDIPTTQQWVAKYASSNLSYLKDLNVAYNSMTQLGAVYTGGKYENLLKNRPRKSLNDDDLKLF